MPDLADSREDCHLLEHLWAIPPESSSRKSIGSFQNRIEMKTCDRLWRRTNPVSHGDNQNDAKKKCKSGEGNGRAAMPGPRQIFCRQQKHSHQPRSCDGNAYADASPMTKREYDVGFILYIGAAVFSIEERLAPIRGQREGLEGLNSQVFLCRKKV